MNLARLAFACGLAICLAISACDKGGSPPTTPTPATATITGRVMSIAGQPLAGARVEARDSAGATTGSDGTYSISVSGVPIQSFWARASAQGYGPQTQTTNVTGDAVINFTLSVPQFVTLGHAVNATTDAGVVNAILQGAGVTGVSDAFGAFTAISTDGDQSPKSVTISGPAMVTRIAQMRVPGPDVTVSLIPTSFDLQSFNQMVRGNVLRRWVSAPRLRVERRALAFVDASATTAVAVADTMTGPEYDELVFVLTSGLSNLSAGTFSSFSGIETQESPEGAEVSLLNSDVITVARFVGLTSKSSFWGYGRWLNGDDGTVYGGLVMIDRDFDRGTSPFRQTLRYHELGHAMGYNHVTGQTSVMNSAAQNFLSQFDRDAFRIAFQRRPGNFSPDTDFVASINAPASRAVWSAPIR